MGTPPWHPPCGAGAGDATGPHQAGGAGGMGRKYCKKGWGRNSRHWSQRGCPALPALPGLPPPLAAPPSTRAGTASEVQGGEVPKVAVKELADALALLQPKVIVLCLWRRQVDELIGQETSQVLPALLQQDVHGGQWRQAHLLLRALTGQRARPWQQRFCGVKSTCKSHNILQINPKKAVLAMEILASHLPGLLRAQASCQLFTCASSRGADESHCDIPPAPPCPQPHLALPAAAACSHPGQDAGAGSLWAVSGWEKSPLQGL